jgi:hypothetical protein
MPELPSWLTPLLSDRPIEESVRSVIETDGGGPILYSLLCNHCESRTWIVEETANSAHTYGLSVHCTNRDSLLTVLDPKDYDVPMDAVKSNRTCQHCGGAEWLVTVSVEPDEYDSERLDWMWIAGQCTACKNVCL